MGDDPIDTSSISFTAHYTGHTWVAKGLSAPEFRTTRGSLYYHALTPLEAMARLAVGDNFRIFLEQRHRMMDHLLREAIGVGGVTQVLEIACGLTPRGCRFVEEFPELTYVEADLPAMAERKRRLLVDVDGPVPDVVDINIFAEEGELSLGHVLERFDRSEPIAVITEGLALYFKRETMAGFWEELVHKLSAFPHATYLSETYLVDKSKRLKGLIQVTRRALGAMARSPVSFHFDDEGQCRSFLAELGFSEVQIHDPRDYYEKLDLPRSGGAPIVRVVEAQVGKDC